MVEFCDGGVLNGYHTLFVVYSDTHSGQEVKRDDLVGTRGQDFAGYVSITILASSSATWSLWAS